MIKDFAMKLYIYDHCPFCVRSRMIFGLKDVACEIITLPNDDEETPTHLIGKKMLPYWSLRTVMQSVRAWISSNTLMKPTKHLS